MLRPRLEEAARDAARETYICMPSRGLQQRGYEQCLGLYTLQPDTHAEWVHLCAMSKGRAEV